jgi:hypothetical protein
LYSAATGGIANTATGKYSLYSNNGSYNVANGVGSLNFNISGSNNSAFGAFSLYSNISGDFNTAIGEIALMPNTTGSNNTGVGWNTLSTTTTGNSNTAIGRNSGGAAGDGSLSNGTALGANTLYTASDQVRVGSSSVTSIGGYVDWTNISDARVKKNIKQNVPGLAFINKLKAVTYNLNLDAVDKILQRPAIKNKDGNLVQPTQQELNVRKVKEQIVYTGFVAQDVEKAAKQLNYDFSGVDAAKNDKDLYGLRYSEFVVPLVKAVQELSQQNEELKKNYEEKIDVLQNQINELKAMIAPGKSTYNAQLSSALLQQNIPNPFNHTTIINYTLPQTYSSAKIVVVDKSGKVLKEVNVSGSGKGNLKLDASTLVSGAYSYSLYIDRKLIDTKQMLFQK